MLRPSLAWPRARATPVPAEGRRWARVYLLLYLVYIACGMAGRWQGWQNVDQLLFVNAARRILDGSWQIYVYRLPGSVPIAPPGGVPYSYAPLLGLLLTPFVALGDSLGSTPLAAGVGGADQLVFRLIALPLLAADVLAMDQFRRLVRAWQPAVDETALFLGILLMLGGGSFFQVSAAQNHHEGLVLLLLLLTLRVTPRNALASGALAGLTLAAKQTADLPLLPVGLLLLANALRSPGGEARRREWGALLAWGGAGGAVFCAFLLPPALADPANLSYALLALPQGLTMFGPGLPGWIDLQFAALLGPASPVYAAWHTLILRYSNPVMLLVALASCGGVLWWSARRGRPLGLPDSRLLALVAAGALLEIDLSKWIGSHYYQLPLALVLLWDTVRAAPRWPALGYGAVLGFRAILVATPLPGVPLARGIYILALFAWLTGRAFGGAAAAAETSVQASAAPEAAPLIGR